MFEQGCRRCPCPTGSYHGVSTCERPSHLHREFCRAAECPCHAQLQSNLFSLVSIVEPCHRASGRSTGMCSYRSFSERDLTRLSQHPFVVLLVSLSGCEPISLPIASCRVILSFGASVLFGKTDPADRCMDPPIGILPDDRSCTEKPPDLRRHFILRACLVAVPEGQFLGHAHEYGMLFIDSSKLVFSLGSLQRVSVTTWFLAIHIQLEPRRSARSSPVMRFVPQRAPCLSFHHQP